MAKKKEFIKFIEIHDTGKTKVFNVVSIEGSDALGKVCWYPGWRRYVFAPATTTLFDSTCLNIVSSFIDDLMNARRTT